ncbi:MAG: FAD-binding oxidoreductase [Mesorhizobium sp.]|nr:MAG: FAD-binding oxidoreductase [Mesorhizobium sp.]
MPRKISFKARQLPKEAGFTGWLGILPTRANGPALEIEARADIAVVGAGFAGLAAARRISEINPKLRVVVLEAAGLAEGASGRNSGFMLDLPRDVAPRGTGEDRFDAAKREIFKNRSAIAFAQNVADQRGWGLEIFNPCGRYSLSNGDEGDHHLRGYASQLNELGEANQLLNPLQTLELTGSSSFTSALFMPGTAIIQPAAYIRSLADSLEDPIRVYERSPALEIEKIGTGWRLRTPGGSVSVEKVILANNGHVQSFGFLIRKLMHVFTYASLTSEFDPLQLKGEREWAATPSLHTGTTIRRLKNTSGDRVLIRSRYSYNPSISVSDGALRRVYSVHKEILANRFPSLSAVNMEYSWAGAMALTWNTVSVVDEVESGIWAVAGCNGTGATNSTTGGIVAAEKIMGVTTPLTEIFAQHDAPKNLPPEPFATIGGKLTLAWKEWRAGAEGRLTRSAEANAPP